MSGSEKGVSSSGRVVSKPRKAVGRLVERGRYE